MPLIGKAGSSSAVRQDLLAPNCRRRGEESLISVLLEGDSEKLVRLSADVGRANTLLSMKLRDDMGAVGLRNGDLHESPWQVERRRLKSDPSPYPSPLLGERGKRRRSQSSSCAAGVLVGCLVLLLTGCASTPKETWTRTGDPLVDGQNAIAHGPEKDRVLWQYRTGLAELRHGNYAEAQRLLGDALLRVGGIIGPDATAKKARSLFHEESKKTFIGEPYERVMAYFYAGILYWMNGEPDNGRACFRNGQIQDSDTENREYANDWVLMDYLDGFISARYFGDDSADALQRAQKSFKIGQLPPFNKKANTMVFLEFGQGPSKYATGEYGEELRIRPGQSVVHGAWVKVENQAVRIGPYDDVNFQATTRGGRVMDHILANKAVFKSATDTFGTAAIIGGAVAASQRGGEEIGVGLLAAGIVSKIFAAATTPEADIRTWDNLPGYISFVALELPLGPHKATVEFTNAAGAVLPSLTKTISFSVVKENSAVLFASDHNS